MTGRSIAHTAHEHQAEEINKFHPLKAMRLDGIALHDREVQCLYWLVRGMSAKEIGSQLCLSRRTVEYYIGEVKRKFGCRKRSSLIGKALDLGFPVSGLV